MGSKTSVQRNRPLAKLKDVSPAKARDESEYAFGIYKHPIADPNVSAPNLRLKRWHHQLTISPDNNFLLGMAVVQLGFAANAWVYVVDFATGTMHEYRDLGPLGLGGTVAASSVRGASSWSKGGNTIRFETHADTGAIAVDVDVLATSRQRIKAKFTTTGPDESLALLHQLDDAGRQAAYTHKAASLRVSEGEFEFGGRKHPLVGGFAALDWTRSYAARVTKWKWACFAGKARDGRAVGLNLSAEVYGDEENAVWVDGKVYQLGHVEFHMASKPWKVTSSRVDLTFVEATEKREDVNALVVKTAFVQLCGKFSGSIVFDEKQLPITFEGLSGVMEDHYAKW
eukprot:TRINITY_DN6982_c0_g1_i1.p1 TRINITY_DN6982_c0_g1~~TRINITY_DN6982_c0_g1_i1.p1  ORF type:complete len:384 (-),score=95.59 TRINITY_DN6982_c0_g1_i1:243-1265(-)